MFGLTVLPGGLIALTAESKPIPITRLPTAVPTCINVDNTYQAVKQASGEYKRQGHTVLYEDSDSLMIKLPAVGTSVSIPTCTPLTTVGTIIDVPTDTRQIIVGTLSAVSSTMSSSSSSLSCLLSSSSLAPVTPKVYQSLAWKEHGVPFVIGVDKQLVYGCALVLMQRSGFNAVLSDTEVSSETKSNRQPIPLFPDIKINVNTDPVFDLLWKWMNAISDHPHDELKVLTIDQLTELWTMMLRLDVPLNTSFGRRLVECIDVNVKKVWNDDAPTKKRKLAVVKRILETDGRTPPEMVRLFSHLYELSITWSTFTDQLLPVLQRKLKPSSLAEIRIAANTNKSRVVVVETCAFVLLYDEKTINKLVDCGPAFDIHTTNKFELGFNMGQFRYNLCGESECWRAPWSQKDSDTPSAIYRTTSNKYNVVFYLIPYVGVDPFNWDPPRV